jgi:DNA-binding NtrC family response regulator
MAHRILLIDDEDDVRTSLRDLLRELPGCSVEVARNCAEGTVKANGAPWDVIICDERMPDGSGTELLSRVARSAPATRLILMSAHQDFAMAVRAINEAKVDAFVEKPWEPGELLQRLTRLLQERPARAGSNLQSRTFRRIGGPPGP